MIVELLDSYRQPSLFPYCLFYYLSKQDDLQYSNPPPFELHVTIQFLQNEAKLSHKIVSQILRERSLVAAKQTIRRQSMRKDKIVVAALQDMMRSTLRESIAERKGGSSLLDGEWLFPDNEVKKLA